MVTLSPSKPFTMYDLMFRRVMHKIRQKSNHSKRGGAFLHDSLPPHRPDMVDELIQGFEWGWSQVRGGKRTRYMVGPVGLEPTTAPL